MKLRTLTMIITAAVIAANGLYETPEGHPLPLEIVATLAVGFLVCSIHWFIELMTPSSFEREMAARTRAQKMADRKTWNSSRSSSSSNTDAGSSGYGWGGDCGGGDSGGCSGGGGDGGGGGGGGD